MTRPGAMPGAVTEISVTPRQEGGDDRRGRTSGNQVAPGGTDRTIAQDRFRLPARLLAPMPAEVLLPLRAANTQSAHPRASFGFGFPCGFAGMEPGALAARALSNRAVQNAL